MYLLFRDKPLAEQAVHGPAKGHSRGPPFSVSGHWRQALQPVKPEGNRTATARAKKLLIVFLTGKGGLLEKLCLGKKIRPGLSLNLKISDARRVALI